MIAIQTSLSAERDKLLAEKEFWNKPSGSALTAAESGPTIEAAIAEYEK